jgi:IS30 family transposase
LPIRQDSTRPLYRELARNSCQYGYRPDWVPQQDLLRCKKLSKLDLNHELRALVVEKHQAGWSPEQIAGRTQLTYNRRLISHETIY